MPLWNKGFSTTVVKIDEQKERTVNYMIGYVTKQDEIGTNQKRYYRTQNLDFKETELTYTTNIDNYSEMVDSGIATLHKDNHRMNIFRISNKPQVEPIDTPNNTPPEIVGQLGFDNNGEIVQTELPQYENGMRVLTDTELADFEMPWQEPIA